MTVLASRLDSFSVLADISTTWLSAGRPARLVCAVLIHYTVIVKTVHIKVLYACTIIIVS